MWIKETDFILFKSSDFRDIERTSVKFSSSPKFALFDLDGTLITSKNGHNPKMLHTDKDPKNYIYLFDKDKYFKIFQTLKDCGFVVGIITNQSRINYRPYGSKAQELHTKNCIILQKIENILDDFQSILGWKPFIVININRNMLKPSIKSFELLKALFQDNLLDSLTSTIETQNINVQKDEVIYTVLSSDLVVSNIFYVGDASGSDDDFIPYRFSSVDKDFVSNVNQILCKNDLHMNFIRAKDFFKTNTINPVNEKEMVILLGNPGSGKSTSAYKFQEAGYKIVIGDELKDKKKMLCFAEFYMNQDKSVVVDALNHTREARASYIKIAKTYDFKVRILWHIRDGRCFNEIRGLYEKEYYGNTVYFHDKPVPDIVYNIYSSKFEPPKEYEIFSGSNPSNNSEGTIQLVY